MTRREMSIAAIGAGVTAVFFAILGSVPSALQDDELLPSSAYEWTEIDVRETNIGASRFFFQAPTRTLDRVRVHVTTLNPGETPHPPHSHANEEILVVKEGTVESFVDGGWHRLGPGSVIFQASNDMHTIRNPGDSPATYHVITWYSPGMLEEAN